MAEIIKKVKVMQNNGTFTDYIPLGADAINIKTEDGESVENKLNKKPYYYNTIADMKADNNLKDGDMAITLGYYSVNDGGAAEYKIRTKMQADVDDGGSKHIINNLVAELIIRDGIVNVKQFGVIGDGIADDTNAMKKAFDIGRLIIFEKDKIYLITQPIILYQGTTVEMNGSVITGQDISKGNHLFHNFLLNDVFLGYEGNGNIIIRNGIIQKGSIELLHGENILFENISFEDCRRDHYFEICACKNVTIRDCTFTGMSTDDTSRKEYINIDNCTYDNFPWLNSNSVMYDGTVVNGVLIDNCTFNINNTLMEDAVGKHSYYSSDHTLNKAENITIRNCRIYGATDCAFYFLGAKNILIDNCYSKNSQRLFQLDNCTEVKISNCISKDMLFRNNINNSEDIIIYNNDTKTSENTFDILLGGVCNKITYSYNKFENKNGTREPLAFIDNETTNITEMSAFDNNFTISSDHGNLFSIPQTGASVSFGKVDNVNFNQDSVTENVLTNNIYNLTNFNRLILEMGQLNAGTYQEVIIKSYLQRNFQVGETYYFPYSRGINSVSVNVGSITIRDEHTLTSTGLDMRYVICQNLPRK